MYAEVIIGVVIALIIFLAVFYVVRSKKKGARCVGCPYASSCSKPACDSTDEEKTEK